MAPNLSGSGSSERPYHAAANGKPVTTPKVPGTPSRRETSHTRDRAVQDPGLKDYRLGDCIGKGAFGSVYKAFNWGTGEAVAVKQIRLADLPKSELRMIEAEIDLLKNLHHDNIVKYIGFVKSTDCLNIILEYCENGSLHSICKAYGKFPENLVGVYMTQVLQGLQYLHDQGVIHRDIKGANILTTKDGTVKLADFGVSTSTLAGPDKEAQVVGTPYWMAPEIIQLSGATSASDIWSVGCTVIELLQGKPPYHNLAAMPALFAIVNDDHPPLPEGVSPAARDFLMQCFQKDPNLRVSARKLLKHSWIIGCRRSDAPVAKTPSNFTQAVEEVKQWNKALKSSEHNLRTSTGSDGAGIPLQLHPHHPRSHVPDGHRPGLHAKGPLALAKPRPTAEAFRSPELADDDNWDNDFATTIPPSALHLPHIKGQDNFGGLLSADRLKAFASIDDSRSHPESWDDSFEGELLTIKGPRNLGETEGQEQTIRPVSRRSEKTTAETRAAAAAPSNGHRRQRSKASAAGGRSQQPRSPVKGHHLGGKFELPPRPDLIYKEQPVEDYSDLVADNDSVFSSNRLNLSLKDAPQLFHPSDLTSLPRSTQSPGGGTGSVGRPPSSSRASVLPDRSMKRARSAVEIQKFAEDEGDEDFSDIFGAEDAFTEKEESDLGSEDANLMLLSKLSNNSWLGDDEDEDDPFAMMDPGWDDMDLEANIARDRHARLAEKVEELVRSLKTTEGEDKLSILSEDLLNLLWENNEVKDLIISAHGLLPILEILEPCTVKSRQHMILQLLKIVNAIILDDVELQENLCFVGGIPIVTKFAARQYSNEIRLEAAAFVRQMYQTSTLTLQMFVSAGGLNVLVEFLDEDYDASQSLVLIGVNGIWNVFELQGPTPKNDFCRIFSRSKILDPLATVLHKVLDEDDKNALSELIEGRIVNIFYLFSQAENYVKEVVAERQVLKTVLRDLWRMTPAHQITMLKFIKNLSMLSTTLESLHSADAIDYLVDILNHSMKHSQRHFRDISNQVLNTMFNLCRLSKERQEYAAGNGIIPLLLKILKTDRPPKEFVLPILCDMAHSGRKGRRFLWQSNGLDFYISLLADQYWQATALDALFVWLQEETAKVESHLASGGKFTAAIVSCFGSAKINAFDPNLLEPLLKVLRLSPSLAASLARPDMYAGIAQRLGHKKAVVRLNLLRLVRSIMDGCEADHVPMAYPGISGTGRQLRALYDVVQALAGQDTAVLVRNLASELVRSHINVDAQGETETLAPLGLGPGGGGVGGGGVGGGPGGAAGGRRGSNASTSGPRIRSGGARRSSSYTPPGLHSSSSMPPTPTQARAYHRASQSSNFVEVASTPRRGPGSSSSSSIGRERDPTMYRPHTRDGVSGMSTPRRPSADAGGGAPPMPPLPSSSSLLSTSIGSANGTSSSAARTRLPRTSVSQFSRPSLATAASAGTAALRGENSMGGGRENGGGRVRPSTSSGVGTSSTPLSATAGSSATTDSTTARLGLRSRDTSISNGGGKRRSRAPSSDVRLP